MFWGSFASARIGTGWEILFATIQAPVVSRKKKVKTRGTSYMGLGLSGKESSAGCTHASPETLNPVTPNALTPYEI